MISARYEKFLLDRNQYDTGLALAPYCGDLLEAAVRRHVCVLGSEKTAAALYRLADIVAVKGIDDSLDADKLREAAAKPEEPDADLKKRAWAARAKGLLVVGYLVAIGALLGAALVRMFS